MSDQLSLFGDPPPSRRPSRRPPTERLPDRLLLVIYLTAAASGAAEALGKDIRDRHRLQGSAIRREILHVTLHHLGNYEGLPPDLVAAAMQACDGVRAYPFEIEFDRLTSFGRGGKAIPVVLWKRDENNPALKAFQQTLALALRQAGLPVDGKFNPHVTLRWDKANVAEQTIVPIAWTANEFALVHSLQGRATHISLARWPLEG